MKRTKVDRLRGIAAQVNKKYSTRVPESEHEHSSGCWPGGEHEFGCDVMQAFEAMREALRDATESLARLPDVTGAWRQTCINQARAALALADKVKP